MKVSIIEKLEGAQLDYWVARVEGHNPQIEEDCVWLYPEESTMPTDYESISTLPGKTICVQFHPSREWHDGGPIIEREKIDIETIDESPEFMWSANIMGTDSFSKGPTPLIAAMRAYVASHFGEEVE
jgi:hypothetical protein